MFSQKKSAPAAHRGSKKQQTTLNGYGMNKTKQSAKPYSRPTPIAINDDDDVSIVSVTQKNSSYFKQPTRPQIAPPAKKPPVPPINNHKADSNPAALDNRVASSSKLINLSAKQKLAYDVAVNQRKNMFITGSAGTGKSVVLGEIIKALEAQYPRSKADKNGDIYNTVQVTASTGIAAFNVGGRTLHSFSGVGLGNGTKEDLLKFVSKSRKAIRRWNEVQALIIDEVSMLDARLLDALEYIARNTRVNHSFFGGVQVILTGDFYQLPPVDKSGTARFAFDSQAWRQGIQSTVVLTHVFRQKDMRFIDMLNELRLGKLSDHGMKCFTDLAREPSYPDDGILPTELYSLRQQVDESNTRRLGSLAGRQFHYAASDYRVVKSKKNSLDDQRVPIPPRELADLQKKVNAVCMAPQSLTLKQFAQVMLIKNMDDETKLVNGSRGVVTGFKMVGSKEFPVVKFISGVEKTVMPESWQTELGMQTYERTQVPLILAWALSIHKSQGQTIDRLMVDLGKVFERGQAYVALSRAVGMGSLQVCNFTSKCVMAHPRVVDFYAELSR